MIRAAALAALLSLGAALPSAAADAQRPDERHFDTGEELARTVTLVTGVPISPLLGVSAVGALRWWNTPESGRESLPWYVRPWFWGPGLGLALLFALNTTIGGLLPGLKKPMDLVEEHENKVSALIASPIVLLEVRRLLLAGGIWPGGAGETGGSLAEAGAASLAGPAGAALDALAAFGLGALYLTAFAIVFLAFHAVQVLIALSPSMVLDLLLRAFRFSLLVVAAAAAEVHPYVGAAYGLVLLALCALIAGWSFRMTVYGSVLSWEVLSGRAGRADPAAGRLVAFAGKGLRGVPVRSLGRLEESEGAWSFRWRPWLVLPRRRVALGAGGELALLRGALSPRLIRTGPVHERTLLRFPPRFRGREEGLAARLGSREVRDGRIVRGLKATWRWLRDLITGVDDLEPAGGGSS